MSIFRKLFGRTDTPPSEAAMAPSETAMPLVPGGNYRFVALDVETANSDRSSICQIGLACIGEDGTCEQFVTLIDPKTNFSAQNIAIHGIRPEHVRGAPTFIEVLIAIQPLLARHKVIQHSSFDKGAIDAACATCGMEAPDWTWLDSVRIARAAWPELKGNGGHGLSHLKRVLQLDFEHHDAGEDARAAAEVVLLAEKATGHTFEDLGAPQRKSQYQKAYTPIGSENGALFGAIVVFTGSLSLSRTEAADLAAGAGMTVKAGVTKKTTHLVVGDQDLSLLAGHEKSSKHRKAEELLAAGQAITILGETEFRQLLLEASEPAGA